MFSRVIKWSQFFVCCSHRQSLAGLLWLFFSPIPRLCFDFLEILCSLQYFTSRKSCIFCDFHCPSCDSHCKVMQWIKCANCIVYDPKANQKSQSNLLNQSAIPFDLCIHQSIYLNQNRRNVTTLHEKIKTGEVSWVYFAKFQRNKSNTKLAIYINIYAVIIGGWFTSSKYFLFLFFNPSASFYDDYHLLWKKSPVSRPSA